MAVRFHAAARTHLGTVRTNNEDSALASDHLLVLADGMGGHAAGEVASVVALRVFAALEHDAEADLGENILHAGRQARRALVAMSDADPMLESLGTTLITVVSDGDRVLVGHIGDSRVYLLRDSSMYQVTTDHTHVQRLIDMGQLTAERARTHPYRAMLLKSLDDHSPGPDLDIIELQVQPGDRILLCSDGLSDYLTAEQIGQALAIGERDDAVLALIDDALAVGTRDNVTVVVADVEDDASATGIEPVFVGAVSDGIGLSDGAAQALTQALPQLRLDPHAPWRHSPLTPDGPEETGDAERTDAGDRAPEETAPDETSPEDAPGQTPKDEAEAADAGSDGDAPDDAPREDPTSNEDAPTDGDPTSDDAPSSEDLTTSEDATPGDQPTSSEDATPSEPPSDLDATTGDDPPAEAEKATEPASRERAPQETGRPDSDEPARARADSARQSPVPALLAAVFSLAVLTMLALFFFG